MDDEGGVWGNVLDVITRSSIGAVILKWLVTMVDKLKGKPPEEKIPEWEIGIMVTITHLHIFM